MALNPTTLRILRGNMSQQALADRTNGAVSKRQISRIEAGHTQPHKVRRHTVEALAKALNVPPERLSCSPEEASAPDSRRGMRLQIKAWIDTETQLYFDEAARRYGVSMEELISAAPWMFTLLAEMSLAERTRRLNEACSAFEHMAEQLPSHVSLSDARRDFDLACDAERRSLSVHDVLGINSPPLVDSDTPDPFSEFLIGLAKACNSSAISTEQITRVRGQLPSWRLFFDWLCNLAGEDVDAHIALLGGFVRVQDIPAELWADDRGDERSAWLASKVPLNFRQEASS